MNKEKTKVFNKTTDKPINPGTKDFGPDKMPDPPKPKK